MFGSLVAVLAAFAKIELVVAAAEVDRAIDDRCTHHDGIRPRTRR